MAIVQTAGTCRVCDGEVKVMQSGHSAAAERVALLALAVVAAAAAAAVGCSYLVIVS